MEETIEQVETVIEEVDSAEDQETIEETPEQDDEEKPEDIEEEAEETEEDEESLKLNAKERIRQLANKYRESVDKGRERDERITYLERQIEAQKKPYFDLDMAKIEQDIGIAKTQIRELEENGQYLAAAREEIKLNNLMHAWDENERKRIEYEAEQGERNKEEQQTKQRFDELGRVAEIFRVNNNIPEDVWNAAGVWFTEELKSNELFRIKFEEKLKHQGPLHTIEFAHEHIMKNMGKPNMEEKEKRETGKKKAIGGSGSTPPPAGKSAAKMTQPEYEAARKAGKDIF